MSEEEIIKYVNEIIKDSQNEIKGKDYFEYIMTPNDIKAIQGLLDLYNKEKSRIMELAGLLDKQESEIKSLQQELEIQKGCSISKNKIRDFIKNRGGKNFIAKADFEELLEE